MTQTSPDRRCRRRGAFAAIAFAVALLAPAVAQAHISLHPNTVPAGAFATLDVRVPGEQEGAHVTKLDMLLPQISEVVEEGHKALVFSQFTSFLALLRKRLDANKTTYEYLDGKTRDRQAKVERFQTDHACRLFLISLKAGGVGLNLTAADSAFLLDPW